MAKTTTGAAAVLLYAVLLAPVSTAVRNNHRSVLQQQQLQQLQQQLDGYSVQFGSCHSIRTYEDDLADTNRWGAPYNTVLGWQRFVVFRLCPNTSGDAHCTSNYGEYMLDLENYLESTVDHYQSQIEDMCQACYDTCAVLDEVEATSVQSRTASAPLTTKQPSVDCYTCQTECEKIENMEDNGYVDATEFLQCQMIYDPEDDGMNALYAGPVCDGDKKIKIGVFVDEYCRFQDDTKKVDDYLMSYDGFLMNISYALLREVYNPGATIDCSTSEVSFLGSVCELLFYESAKCESDTGMVKGMHSFPIVYSNQLRQEADVCQFIERVKNGTYEDAPFSEAVDSQAEQQSTVTAQARHGPPFWHLEDPGIDTKFSFDNFTFHFDGCQQYPSWNWEAFDETDVRISTKRLAHYRLCSTDSCQAADSGGEYVLDLTDLLVGYIFNNSLWSCDYLMENVCYICNDDAVCLRNCYDLHGMSGECLGTLQSTSAAIQIPRDSFECQSIRNIADVFVGPHCVGREVRFAIFSDSSCSILLAKNELPDTMTNFTLFYEDHSLIHEGQGSCGGGRCDRIQEKSGRCDYESSITSFSGDQTNNACDYIREYKPKLAVSSNSGGSKIEELASPESSSSVKVFSAAFSRGQRVAVAFLVLTSFLMVC